MRNLRNPYRDPSKLRRFLAHLGVGTGVGAFCGLIYVWQFAPSLKAFLASLAAGAVAGMVFGGVLALQGTPTRPRLFAAAALSGAAGGMGWWAVAQPSLDLVWVAAIGAGVVVVIMILAELGVNI